MALSNVCPRFRVVAKLAVLAPPNPQHHSQTARFLGFLRQRRAQLSVRRPLQVLMLDRSGDLRRAALFVCAVEEPRITAICLPAWRDRPTQQARQVAVGYHGVVDSTLRTQGKPPSSRLLPSLAKRVVSRDETIRVGLDMLLPLRLERVARTRLRQHEPQDVVEAEPMLYSHEWCATVRHGHQQRVAPGREIDRRPIPFQVEGRQRACVEQAAKHALPGTLPHRSG
jgi:hypothetical protein